MESEPVQDKTIKIMAIENSGAVYNNEYKQKELSPLALDNYLQNIINGGEEAHFIYRHSHYATFKKSKIYRFYEE